MLIVRELLIKALVHFLIEPLQLEHSDKLHKHIYHNDSKEYAVNTVENTTMAGHKMPAVLDMRLALDKRFGQISQCRCYSDQDAQDNGKIPGYSQGNDGECEREYY